MKKKMIISLVLGLMVSALAVYFAFKNVPFDKLILYLPTINLLWALPSVAIVVVTFLLRVLRWRIILSASHDVPFWRAFHPLMIGFMINCILPGRVGEVARPVLLQAKEKVPFSTGLATVAAERIFDLLMLMALLVGVLLTVDIDPSFSMSFGDYALNRETLMNVAGGMAKLSILMMIGFVLVLVSRTRNLIIKWILFLPNLLFFLKPATRDAIGKSVVRPLADFVENLAPGLMLLKDIRKLALCTGISVIIWGLHGIAYYTFSLGCPGIDISFSEMVAVLVITCFFIALPSVPGFWGLWEAGGIFALTLFGVSLNDAAGFTLANHVIQMLPVMIIGFISALMTGVNVWRISYEPGLAALGP